MKEYIREIDEIDRHYRHYIAKIQVRLNAKSPVIPVLNALLPTRDQEVTVGDDTPQTAPLHPTTSGSSAGPPPPVPDLTVTSDDPQLATGFTEAQAKVELDTHQPGVPGDSQLGPRASSSRLHMLDNHGVVTKDPTKCYLWTREELGYGWWYASEFPPPQSYLCRVGRDSITEERITT